MDKKMLTPKEIAQTMLEISYKKAMTNSCSLLILAILAGMYIAFGSVGFITIIAKVQDAGLAKFLGAAVFPVGLMLVVMAGAELFTGNNLMTLGIMAKRFSFKDMFRNWGIVYFGNFIGSIFVVFLVANTGLFSGVIAEKVVIIATAKTSLTFSKAIFRAVMCNMIVVLAVWFSVGAKDIIGKIFACWFPIMLFVVSGYEHSVANMFFIPMGKYLGANISWGDIWFNNLIPVTLGNIIGGAVIIPMLYYFVYLRDEK
ncbi:formate/nitrite transporter [Caminicella sporogenes DSM 14501]|uniref:Formate/nitrite transporter n=1 Tax=Caminicella sporogenes DSM 14501 TaxID=1121266 RepID=A0A1M6RJ46_9FIRM|nr:formate/nitrite transporter family protein [Caminicella sporogenes]SHK32473.1 formate/nitrite transporter [Caminicella sporogenes DSM 14501]